MSRKKYTIIKSNMFKVKSKRYVVSIEKKEELLSYWTIEAE